MGRDAKSSSKPASVARLAGIGALAAFLGFAAVYVTLGPADNRSSAAVAPGAGEDAKLGQRADLSGPAGELVGFVRRREPLPVADISFETEAGEAIALSSFRGKTVLLNLWATWCGPCRKEMPSLDRLEKELGSANFQVLALSLDRAGAEAARKFYSETGVENLQLYIDPTMRAGSSLKAVGMPTTILIDAEGREVGRLPGPAEWDSEAAKKIIAEAMK